METETTTVTMAEAARRLGISKKTLYKAVHLGQLRRVRVGDIARIPVADIERLIAGAEPVKAALADRVRGGVRLKGEHE